MKGTGLITGVAGLTITYVQYSNGEMSGKVVLADVAFGTMGFGGSRGATISIAYFGIKAIYEYSTENSVFEKPGGN
ncbi:MAG: hypothetical protein BGO31_16760 [Bacteroidetes bacterium 43-16]|nr:MAG: hypothetical protein BGO31_16760 [Bacteroidetes bacterium 43-16]